MWSESIQDFKGKNKQVLDLKLELHLVIHVKELLTDKINFSLENDQLQISLLEEDKQKKILTNDEFYYWWQITRFDEIISEEEIIFNDFNKLKDKILNAIQKLEKPLQLSAENQQRSDKILKLNKRLQEEVVKSNMNINSLKSFRSIYPSYESLERFIRNIKILLQN